MRGGWTARAGTAATLVLAAIAQAGCLAFLGPPAVVSDPARSAPEPARHRGDRLDRQSLETLHRWGADLGVRPEEASDEQVAREALRVAPLAAAERRRLPSDLFDARTMVLRRRLRAACVALGDAMQHPDPRVREGAAYVFGDLDTQGCAWVEPDWVPPWSGPERELALARLEALLDDPDAAVRFAAASELRRGIGGRDRPSWGAVLARVEREPDPEVKDFMLWLLSTLDAPPADRLAAADRHAPDWILASWLVEGTVVPANRELLEGAFEHGGRPLRVAILKAAEDLPPPQPWLAGIVRLGRADPENGVRQTAAWVEESVVAPRPEAGDDAEARTR